jgi:hypothetical protein
VTDLGVCMTFSLVIVSHYDILCDTYASVCCPFIDLSDRFLTWQEVKARETTVDYVH